MKHIFKSIRRYTVFQSSTICRCLPVLCIFFFSLENFYFISQKLENINSELGLGRAAPFYPSLTNALTSNVQHLIFPHSIVLSLKPRNYITYSNLINKLSSSHEFIKNLSLFLEVLRILTNAYCLEKAILQQFLYMFPCSFYFKMYLLT